MHHIVLICVNFMVDAIDNKDIDEIENLRKKIYKNGKNDIIIEIYNNKLFTYERFQFIVNYCNKYFNIKLKLMTIIIKR